MLKFIAKDRQTNILTRKEGIMLGYINENNVFFPNNNMMFKTEWMLEIARYMQKQKLMQGEIPMSNGIVAHYQIKEIKL